MAALAGFSELSPWVTVYVFSDAKKEEKNEDVILSSLYTAQSTMEKMLKSMEESFDTKLFSIAVSKKRCSVFFTAVAMICAAATPIVAVNAFHNRSWERAGIAGAAAAFSILFTETRETAGISSEEG
ncbi:hypothetical protein SASPL_136709 [Salvia splendens]|uniref:Uncharacterized protein n=1 Tax=Salvia splendens TaxID=180675 RepID=A0A8X8X2Q4_SALSN|nr:hypothetical protein SASPL_136709 [Salvia splendens]